MSDLQGIVEWCNILSDRHFELKSFRQRTKEFITDQLDGKTIKRRKHALFGQAILAQRMCMQLKYFFVILQDKVYTATESVPISGLDIDVYLTVKPMHPLVLGE
jgi:hypothetical protein